jgi:hypothetical protein
MAKVAVMLLALSVLPVLEVPMAANRCLTLEKGILLEPASQWHSVQLLPMLRLAALLKLKMATQGRHVVGVSSVAWH